MITQEQIEKLASSTNILLTHVGTQVEALRNSMDSWDFWLLESIQDIAPFLSFLSGDRLTEVGPVIITQLQVIKIYPGIISILQKLYENTAITIDSPRPGTLSLYMSGENLGLLEHLILSNGEEIHLSSGGALSLKGEFTAESVSFDDFINNFFLAGVHLTEFAVNAKTIFEIYTHNNAVLLSGNRILGKEITRG